MRHFLTLTLAAAAVPLVVLALGSSCGAPESAGDDVPAAQCASTAECPKGYRCEDGRCLLANLELRVLDAPAGDAPGGDVPGDGDPPPDTMTGSCPGGDPPDLGQPCGECGGTVTCDGSCSAETPANLGESCNGCGGRIGCDGRCTPACPACTTCTRADGTCGHGGIASECGVNGDPCQNCVDGLNNNLDYCTGSGICTHCRTCTCVCNGATTCKDLTLFEANPSCAEVCGAGCTVAPQQTCPQQCPAGGA